MEVPIINNLNDNGDRQRTKGKDVFKDQQKESEVNVRGVCVQSVGLRQLMVCRSALEGVCVLHMCVCVCVKCKCVCCCCWGAFMTS